MSNKCDGTQWTEVERRHHPKGSRVIVTSDSRGQVVVIIERFNLEHVGKSRHNVKHTDPA